eukprot:8942129-Alexandrium_andersonii.AAC.1
MVRVQGVGEGVGRGEGGGSFTVCFQSSFPMLSFPRLPVFISDALIPQFFFHCVHLFISVQTLCKSTNAQPQIPESTLMCSCLALASFQLKVCTLHFASLSASASASAAASASTSFQLKVYRKLGSGKCQALHLVSGSVGSVEVSASASASFQLKVFRKLDSGKCQALHLASGSWIQASVSISISISSSSISIIQIKSVQEVLKVPPIGGCPLGFRKFVRHYTWLCMIA